MSERNRSGATETILEFFKATGPELVYIMPTKGTAAVVSIICMSLKIPYILVSPYPGFFNGVNHLDKVCIKAATSKAKSFIIVHDDEPKDAAHGDEIWEESVEFLSSVSSAIVFMYSKKAPHTYMSFIDKVCTANEGKPLWEVIYDKGHDATL